MQWLGPALVTEEVRRLNLLTCLTDRLNIRERAACLALAMMLGTARGPSLTTLIGRHFSELKLTQFWLGIRGLHLITPG